MGADLDPSSRCAILHVDGCLDEISAPRFRELLHDAIDRGYHDVIVDLQEARGVSSVGIGALICGLRRFGDHQGRIVLAGCKPPLDRLLQMAGVCKLFPLHPGVDEARAALFQVSSQVFEPARENGARLRAWLTATLSTLPLSANEREAVHAAASEAFMNAVQHAAPTRSSLIIVRVAVGSSLTIEVQDRGPGFEARQYFAADPDCVRSGHHGLGIQLMRNLMDRVEFVAGASGTSTSPAGTTVRMVKHLAAPAAPANGAVRR